MELYEISFFNKFSCAMGDCPNTCCRGWRVIFDEETYQRYLAEPGKNGIRLRSSIVKMGGDVYFRDTIKGCTFHEKGGLCNLQRTIGEEYMPEVCRLYPRFRQHYGVFAEETLFLSCPLAARLFLEHVDGLVFVKSGREVTYERWGTNDDGTFLRWLCGLRKEMTAALWDESRSLAQIFAQLAAVMRDIQKLCISGAELPPVKEIMQKHYHGKELVISARITDQMMTGGFYHSRLKRISPKLYALCRSYFKNFDKLTEAQADGKAAGLKERLHGASPKLSHVLRGYVVYYLQMVFLEVYEDYSFVKKLAGGIMHVHMLELFLALYFDKTKSLTDDELALVISVYDRRGRHNDEVAEGMYEKIYPALQV